MSEELPPLPDDVLALLTAEKPLLVGDAAQRARVFSRVESSISTLAAAGAAGAATEVVVTVAKGKLVAWLSIAAIAGAGIGGVATGIVMRAAPAPVTSAPAEGPADVRVAASATAPAIAPSIAVDDLPSASSAPVARLPIAQPATSLLNDEARARGLAAERALLDVARSALARGVPEEATEATRRHERLYPQGVLAEEREALAIRALVALGQREEALSRADRFRRRYPKSLMLPAVDAAVGAPKP